MFKPVTGDQLAQFDPETIDLFRRRETDPSIVAQLAVLPRRARHHLPVIVDKNNKFMQEQEREHRNFWWQLSLGFAFFGKFVTFYNVC